jgi:hypothetical protein
MNCFHNSAVTTAYAFPSSFVLVSDQPGPVREPKAGVMELLGTVLDMSFFLGGFDFRRTDREG